MHRAVGALAIVEAFDVIEDLALRLVEVTEPKVRGRILWSFGLQSHRPKQSVGVDFETKQLTK